MSITKAELRSEANQRSGREWSEAEITIALKSLLHELARENLLRTSAYASTTEGIANYEISNGKKLLHAQYYDATEEEYSRPMDMISWYEYREELGRNLSNSKPTKVTFFDEYMYVSPAPDTTGDRIYFTALIKHADVIGTIAFEDNAREALVEGLCFKCYELAGLQSDPKALAHKQLYEVEKEGLARDLALEKIGGVRYSDI